LTEKTALWPFPKLSNVSKEKTTLAAKLELRSFGSAVQDLEVNFNDNSPNLVTQIIRLCTVAANDVLPAEHFYWSLEVGKRIECLISIANSEHSSHLVTIIKCLKEDCQKYLELSLSLNDLLLETSNSNDCGSCSLNIFDKNIILRKPTGSDQLSWLNLDRTNQKEAVNSIIAILLNKDGDLSDNEIKLLSDDAIQQIGEALSKIDPLLDYKIELKCPICRTSNIYRIDLEKLLLKKLREIQKELISTVHRLASNYHWTEKEILSIPSSRRSLYLSLIEGEY
jgi:hypothetical protein